ncbi:hypothetical protein U1Q18_038265 [Sarracenia purpurea var. burkii]
MEEAPPILLIAIGLDNGCIYGIEGDIAREHIKCFKLQVDNHSDKSQSSITGMRFQVDGQATQLFAVTPISVSLFSLQTEPYSGHTLDQIGCNANAVAMSDCSELIIGRDEIIYFYKVDGRGPCWAFKGEKKFVGWFCEYLLCVIADQRSGKNTFNIYDPKNHLIAHSLVIKEVSQMLCEWGNILLIMEDNSALCIGEKDMESKLDMLFKKNLYTVAINLVQSQQADVAATAEVLRKYGDHLYSKQEYDEAMAQEHKFDVETAIRVCRAANYHEHAMYVAKKAGRHEWYLKILLEDLGSYEEALQYISSLEPSQAGVTVKKYGKILIEHKPNETIEILLRLCTEEGEPHKIANIDDNNNFRGERPPVAAVMPTANSNGKLSADHINLNKEKDHQKRLQKRLHLLKTAWPSDVEYPLYDVDLAIILCEMNAFKEGLLHLYEKMKLYKEVMACYMQAHDHEGLIACCKKLGDSGKGGDPTPLG